MVSPSEYFQYALRHDLLSKLKFFYSTMTIPLQDTTDYFKIEKNKYFILMNNEYRELQGKTSKEPIFTLKDKILLFNADMVNIKDKVDTTIGRAIVNYILLAKNFGAKLDYINDGVGASKFEDVVVEALKKDEVTVEEYINFVNSCTMLQGLSRIVTIAATYKVLTPPPNLEKFKKDLIAEFDKKYGKSWVKNEVNVIEFGNRLKEEDAKYLADDPTNNKLLSGKVKENARAKMYLSFGADAGFNEVGADASMVFNSLLEGYPEDKEQLAAIYNSSRAGSFSRGAETQDGGVLAKVALRSTANLTIEPGDCGAKQGKELYVTKDLAKALNGRYLIKNNKIEKIEDGSKLVGQTIMLRSPMYCNYRHPTFCSACVGDNLANYRKGATVEATLLSNTILTLSLKKMHNATKKIHTVELSEMIK